MKKLFILCFLWLASISLFAGPNTYPVQRELFENGVLLLIDVNADYINNVPIINADTATDSQSLAWDATANGGKGAWLPRTVGAINGERNIGKNINTEGVGFANETKTGEVIEFRGLVSKIPWLSATLNAINHTIELSSALTADNVSDGTLKRILTIAEIAKIVYKEDLAPYALKSYVDTELAKKTSIEKVLEMISQYHENIAKSVFALRNVCQTNIEVDPRTMEKKDLPDGKVFLTSKGGNSANGFGKIVIGSETLEASVPNDSFEIKIVNGSIAVDKAKKIVTITCQGGSTGDATSIWGYKVPKPTADDNGKYLCLDFANKGFTWSASSSGPSIAGILVNGVTPVMAKKAGDMVTFFGDGIGLEGDDKNQSVTYKYIKSGEVK